MKEGRREEGREGTRGQTLEDFEVLISAWDLMSSSNIFLVSSLVFLDDDRLSGDPLSPL